MTTTPAFQEPLPPEVLAAISGRELLIGHLGHWPSFHDFEVLSILLERALVSASTHDLKATFLVFDLNKGPDDPDRRQASAEFLFEGIEALRVDGFDHQNPILGLSILSLADGRYQVGWGGIQHDVSFTCWRVAVLRVVDLNPFRQPSLSL